MFFVTIYTLCSIWAAEPRMIFPSSTEIKRVYFNLILGDVIFYYALKVIPFTDVFSFGNLIKFIIAQDIYTYILHKFFHTNFKSIHQVHHDSKFGGFYALNMHWIEAVGLAYLSIGIPFYLFPNTSLTLVLIAIFNVMNSIKGHRFDSGHEIHHIYTWRRIGTTGLIDKIMGTH